MLLHKTATPFQFRQLSNQIRKEFPKPSPKSPYKLFSLRYKYCAQPTPLSHKPYSTIMSSTIPKTMRAAVIYTPGGPESLKVEDRPVPVPTKGQVLIRVHACGLNRSELFTRQGHSPGVQFPRVLGIEATGVVAACPGGEFSEGATVATAMGGIGRDFDGGYAEYTCVPARQVVQIKDTHGLEWKMLGAVPEMLQTAWGSLMRALRIQSGDRLLIRGGTTSVGLAAAAIAKAHGVEVMGTSRRAGREELMKSSGCSHVVIDNGSVKEAVYKIWPKGATKVLELVGTVSLIDSLSCIAVDGGICCMTGIVGNSWALKEFQPMGDIPTAVCLTSYAGGNEDFVRTPLDEMLGQIANGQLKAQVGKVFSLEQVVEAHRVMDANTAGGKIVLVM